MNDNIILTQLDLVNLKLNWQAKKFELSKDNTIQEISRYQEKVQGIDDFESKKFELTKSDCLLYLYNIL